MPVPALGLGLDLFQILDLVAVVVERQMALRLSEI